MQNTAVKKVNCVLFALIASDVTLSVAAFFFPTLWFAVFHGVPYVDPEGFLRRCAASWAAFALFQGIALCRWKQRPYWLCVVAGIRLSDVFTDWVYLFFAHDVTWFGRVSLFAVSPMNAVIGLWLMRTYLTLKA